MNKSLKNLINRTPDGVIEIIATIFYTVKYNWFYILLSVLAPLIIYKMGAGGEIIALLFESKLWLINIICLVLTLALMSTTIWHIPSLSVYQIALYSKIVSGIPFDSRFKFYQYLLRLYSSDSADPIHPGQSQIPSKYLAMVPWTMVCATVIQYRLGDTSILLFLVVNCGLLSLMAFCSALYKRKERSTLIKIILLFVACLAYFIYTYTQCQSSGTASKVEKATIAIYFIYLGSMIVAFMLLGMGESWYLKLATKDPIERKDLIKNNILHAILFLLNLGALMRLTYLAIDVELPAVSTLIVLLLCLNFYMLIVDILFTSQWVMSDQLKPIVDSKRKWLGYKLLLGILLFFFIKLVLFSNTNNYNHSLPQTAVRETDTLEAYFDKWYKAKCTDTVDRVMNVYLISGQGGGSRAAVYMLAVLREIEQAEKELYRQTFSISTISGSSAGIGQYIGQHKNTELEDRIKNDTSPRSFDQLKLAYCYNYFNSNLLGLLFYDRIPLCIKNLIHKPESNTYAGFNRNYIQEREELKQLHAFTDSIFGEIPHVADYSFMQRNILDLYQREDSFSTPLVFFNTTVLNQGRKGVFSPIKDTMLFCNNVDLLTSNKPVSFHFAEISSQSFPLLNNFSSFGEFYLGDGGIYENSGTSTTTQIYRRLRQYCNRKNYKVRFIILNVLNGASDTTGNEVCDDKKKKPDYDKKSIMALLLEAVSKIPFEGHETDAKLSIVQEIMMNDRNLKDSTIRDTIFNIHPEEQFALSRVFCQSTMNKFIAKDKIKKSIQSYIDYKNRMSSADSSKKSKLAAENNVYQLYTQYRNSDDKEDVKAMLKGAEVQNVVSNIRPIDRVQTAEYGNEIRYFHPEDRIKAEKLNATLPQKFKLVYVTNGDLQEKTPTGQLELWIDSLGNDSKEDIRRVNDLKLMRK